MKELKDRTTSNGMKYVLAGDYYIPDLQLPEETEGITEKLKSQDQMAWVRAMNSIHSRAEEIILRELIYEEDAV